MRGSFGFCVIPDRARDSRDARRNAIALRSVRLRGLLCPVEFDPHALVDAEQIGPLFVEADDNYSTVNWREENGIRKKLLRINLKNIETQFSNSFTLRCHRSYIVNVNAISAISGNTNGYKLKITGTDFSIPVSRPKGKEVMEKISQLRNMMELS